MVYYSNTPPKFIFARKGIKNIYCHLENLKNNVSLGPRTLKHTFVRMNVQEKLKKIQGD